jgi:hypothetical protein
MVFLTLQATGSGIVPQLQVCYVRSNSHHQFLTIDAQRSFTIEGLKIIPLEVFHGKDYTCLGIHVEEYELISRIQIWICRVFVRCVIYSSDDTSDD